MVNFAKAVGSTLDNIWDAAVQGVYRFFSILFPDTPKAQYPAFNYWRGNNIMDDDTYFFIRCATYELTDKSFGFGVIVSKNWYPIIGWSYGELSDSMPVGAYYYQFYDDKQYSGLWWYVSNIVQSVICFYRCMDLSGSRSRHQQVLPMSLGSD